MKFIWSEEARLGSESGRQPVPPRSVRRCSPKRLACRESQLVMDNTDLRGFPTEGALLSRAPCNPAADYIDY